MDELRGKDREFEKLSKLLNNRKLAPPEHDAVSMHHSSGGTSSVSAGELWQYW